MNTLRLNVIASVGLVVGSVLGLAGTFVPSVALRGLLWGVDGIALVIAAAILAVQYFRKGNDAIAAAFLVFMAGQTLVLSTAAMDLRSGGPVFGAGVSLWAASLYLLSAPRTVALWARATGVIAGTLFLIVAVQLFLGHALTALSQPLPFFAYPFLVATLLGWAWESYRSAD